MRHTSIRLEIVEYEKLNLHISQFIHQFYHTVGANVIPLSQYAKFLEILRNLGEKGLVQLLALLLTKKRNEFYMILKYWTHSEFNGLRNYSRTLNWDLFFEEV